MVARRIAIRLATFAGVSALVLACSDAATGNQPVVRLRFSTAPNAVASSPPPRPFVGILDSLDVVVWLGGRTLTHFGQHLSETDTGEVTHSLGVMDGRISIVAQILSVNGSALHRSTTNVTVSKKGGEIDVALPPLVPIILASPDTLWVNTTPAQAVNDSFKVYNRGIGFLGWNLAPMDPPRPTLRNCAINCLQPRDSKGVIREGDSMFVHIDSIYNVAGPVRFTLTTTHGNITVVVRRR